MDIVEVWRIGCSASPELTTALEQVLSDDEHTRRAGFADPVQRHRFLVAHAAVRSILGGYLSQPPARISLRTGRYGKPEVDGGPRFNLTHSSAMALLAVTATRAVGVDVERDRPGRPVATLAARFFPPAETALLSAAPVTERSTVYLRLWTRKEACVKAAGARLADGLRLPVATDPNRLPDPGDRVGSMVAEGGLVVADPWGRLPGPWRVRDLDAPEGYAAAVALAGPEPYGVRYRQWCAAMIAVGAQNPQYH